MYSRDTCRREGRAMKKITLIPTRLLLALVLVAGFVPASVDAQDFQEAPSIRHQAGPKFVPGEIIVKFKSEATDDDIAKINSSHASSILSESRRGKFKRLRTRRDRSVDEMVRIYRKENLVAYAEPNFIAHAHVTPNDPFYSLQWHLDNPVTGGIHMESAWDTTAGSSAVIVAVLDTGVAYEDFGTRFKQAPDLANTTFVPGFDFVNNDTHPNDDNNHGTHVTGTIAQSTNNGLGVAGVAFNTSIMPVKVLDRNGSGTHAAIAEGIRFAAENGAKVINMSLGGPSPSVTLENALAYAYNLGVTIVASAGNDGNGFNFPSYPAAYDAYVIAVGATRFDEARSYYSNTGSYLDLTAPGGDMTVDQNGDGFGDGVLQQTFGNRPTNFGYWFFQGTSMAAPHVSGVAALVIANGVTGPADVRQAIEISAEDHGPPGWDPEYGWGIVDAFAALAFSPAPTHDVAVTAVDAPLEVIQGDPVVMSVTVANQGTFGETTVVTLTDTTTGSIIGTPTPVTLAAGASQVVSFSWDTTGAGLGPHAIVAEATAVTGETDPTDNTMSRTVTVIEQPTADVSIVSISARNIREGQNYRIQPRLSNNGGTTVTVQVTCDVTGINGSQSLTHRTVVIAAGDEVKVNFNDTSTLSSGSYTATVTVVESGATGTAQFSIN